MSMISLLEFLVKSLSYLPDFLIDIISKNMGYVIYFLDYRHRKIALDNLEHAFKDKTHQERSKICIGVYQHLLRLFFERIKVHRIPFEILQQNLIWEGREYYDLYLKSNGALYLTGHCGNWEMFTAFGPKMALLKSVLVRRVKNRAFENLLRKLREYHGCQVIYKGPRLRRMLDSLRHGEQIGVLNDQDAGANGVFVPFFGRLASMHAGMVEAAIKQGVEIFPLFMIREPGHWIFRAILLPPIVTDISASLEQQVKDVLMQFSVYLEQTIRRFPEQWLWLHRRWKTRPKVGIE